MRITDLKRNDIAGAVAYYTERKKAGTLTPEDMHVLVLLQNNPGELRAALKALHDG